MTWPALGLCVKVIDESEYQLLPDYRVVEEENPELVLVISRLADVWMRVDDVWPHHYDGPEDMEVGAYGNFNPSRSVDAHILLWEDILGTRDPRLIVIDCESSAGQSPATITLKLGRLIAAAKLRWPNAAILVYTAAWWWNPNIVHGASWIADTLFWIANYPYVVEYEQNKYRVAFNYDELDPLLPISNNFTPRIPIGITIDQTAGWQASDKGIIKGITVKSNITPRVDLNYFKKWWFIQVFDPAAPPPSGCDIPEYIPADMRSIANSLRDEADEVDVLADALEAL